jgi:HAMP domain-containing protein
MVLLVLGSIMLGLGLGVFISRLIGNPMKKLVEVGNKLAVGDMDVDIEATTKDEIGDVMKAMNTMVTNLHLPHSTPLMMVSAFAGKERILKAYEEAVREKYRFFSYGDSMLIL